MCSNLLRLLTSGDLDLDLWPFQLKIGSPLTCVLGNVYTILTFPRYFLLFSSYEPVWERWTDGQTDGRTGKTRNVA